MTDAVDERPEPSTESSTSLAQQIADQLGETEHSPREQIRKIVELCGTDFARTALQEALEVEARGGLMTRDGKRRRTVGGVFFYLVRGKITAEQSREIFGEPEWRRRKQASRPSPPFPWEERMAHLRSLLEKKGRASAVRVTLVGRPRKVKKRQDTVITVLEHSITKAGFPRGVPAPPDTPTNYAVYISARQWARVEASIVANKDDALIIEGHCAYDPDLPGIAVFATNVTTKLQQQARREEQRAKTQAEGQEPGA